MTDDLEPIDMSDPRHPDHHRVAEQRAPRPDPALQRAVSDQEYALELEARVSFLQRRVRQLALERELQDKVQREQEAELARLRGDRGAPDGGSPAGG